MSPAQTEPRVVFQIPPLTYQLRQGRNVMLSAQAAYHMPMFLTVVVVSVVLPVSEPALFVKQGRRITPLFAKVMQAGSALVACGTVAYAFFQHDLPPMRAGTHRLQGATFL